MRGFKILSIVVLLTFVNTLCSGAVTRNNGPDTATVQTGKTTILDGPKGSIKVLDGPKGKVRRETNTSVIEPHASNASYRVRRRANVTVVQIHEMEPNGFNTPDLGEHNAPGKVRREANASVIEHLGPKSDKLHGHAPELIAHNAPGKERRENNSFKTLHHVPLTKERMRREAKLLARDPNASNGASTTLKPTHSAVNASMSIAATTPSGFGNMITVPDNCPEGKKYVNGECREIWEPSR